jgi:hypothetical protein
LLPYRHPSKSRGLYLTGGLRCSVTLSVEKERKHKRAPLTAHVMLLIGESEHPVVRRGMVSDISLGGIGLYLVQPLEVGVTVNLEIRFLIGGGGINTAKVRGTTIYSNLVGDTYYVGIEFDQELSPKGHPELYRRIQEILSLY